MCGGNVCLKWSTFSSTAAPVMVLILPAMYTFITGTDIGSTSGPVIYIMWFINSYSSQSDSLYFLLPCRGRFSESATKVAANPSTTNATINLLLPQEQHKRTVHQLGQRSSCESVVPRSSAQKDPHLLYLLLILCLYTVIHSHTIAAEFLFM